MLQIGLLGFVQPWLLAALATLPALWWLLRVTPPAPRRQRFPAIALLQGLTPKEETAARTPLWLILLRLLALALIILGLAQPIMNPAGGLSGSGPLVIAMDNDWASAHRWDRRQAVLARLLDQAEREGREVALLTTARSQPGEGSFAEPSLLTAQQARQRAEGLRPLPWPADYQAAAEALENWRPGGSVHAVWLSNGLAAGEEQRAGQAALGERLQRLGRLDLYRDAPEDLPLLLREPQCAGGGLVVPLERPQEAGEASYTLAARDQAGRLLGEGEARFAAEARETTAAFDLPIELRNRIVSITVSEQRHAGARLLLDDSWQRRSVGLVVGGGADSAQPLLSEVYYLERALAPYAEVTRAPVDALIERGVGTLLLADSVPLTDSEIEALYGWTEAGGVLVRFAGPRLAESLDQTAAALPVASDGRELERRLLPVSLRRGGRSFGGSLTWDQPLGLDAFPEASPLAGLAIPQDVSVNRQVLAEPSPELGQRTWARLTDGTPLVTGAPLENGWRVLVHTTANPTWSDLALSGLFVEMLRRFAELGGSGMGNGGNGQEAAERLLAPVESLDGFGDLVPPPAGAQPVAAGALERTVSGPSHPPGFYGLEDARRSLNLASGLPTLESLAPPAGGIRLAGYEVAPERSLGPWLLAAGTLLLLLDLLIALFLRGLLPRPGGLARGSGVTALLLAFSLSLAPGTTLHAQDELDDEDFAVLATQETRLAFVQTSDSRVDAVSERGLIGLSRILARRTSVEPQSPLGVDLERHDLRFFPFVYWPISAGQADLSPEAAANLNAYLESGGTLLIDLREAGFSGRYGGASPAQAELQRLTRDLELPEVTPIDPEHVLTRAFYLLQDFPGRYDDGTLWIERQIDQSGEGVARLIVGANDWAGAWAVDDQGRHLNAVTPGGERQREFAYRFGVNAVIYALTGNYKEDQVHVPAILERLGQ